MDGYTLQKCWFKFASENGRIVKPIHHAVMWWVSEKANLSRWKREFQLSTSEACEILGISDRNTYQKAFKELVSFGAIKMTQEAKGTYSARFISLDDCPIYLVEIPFIQPVVEPVILPVIQPVEVTPIIKQENRETIKTINITFQVFWDLYGKKEDRVKSEKKWLMLSDKERELAIEDIPKYIASLRDRQYQKNPLTYLNGKCWLDGRDQLPVIPPNQQPFKRFTLNDKFGG